MKGLRPFQAAAGIGVFPISTDASFSTGFITGSVETICVNHTAEGSQLTLLTRPSSLSLPDNQLWVNRLVVTTTANIFLTADKIIQNDN